MIAVESVQEENGEAVYEMDLTTNRVDAHESLWRRSARRRRFYDDRAEERSMPEPSA